VLVREKPGSDCVSYTAPAELAEDFPFAVELGDGGLGVTVGR
jgi:hypothetical protein